MRVSHFLLAGLRWPSSYLHLLSSWGYKRGPPHAAFRISLLNTKLRYPTDSLTSSFRCFRVTSNPHTNAEFLPSVLHFFPPPHSKAQLMASAIHSLFPECAWPGPSQNTGACSGSRVHKFMGEAKTTASTDACLELHNPPAQVLEKFAFDCQRRQNIFKWSEAIFG
jgi:hypothetical protein